MSTTYPLVEPRRPGRPPVCRPEVALRIIELRRNGLSYSGISAVLNRDGVATPAGGSVWAKSHVARLLYTRHLSELAERQAVSAGRRSRSRSITRAT